MWPGATPHSTILGAAGLTLAAIIIGGLYLGRELLMPIALAALLGFVLSPLVKKMVRWRLPRSLAVGIVIALLLAFIVGSIGLLGLQVTTLAESLPGYQSNLSRKIEAAKAFVGNGGAWSQAFGVLQNLQNQLMPEAVDKAVEVKTTAAEPMGRVFSYLSMSVPTIGMIFLVVVLTAFILLQYEDIRDRAVRLMGVEEIGRSTQAIDEVGKDLAQFFLLQATLNAAFGAAIGLLLWFIGVPGAILWGFMAAAMRFVPYIGSVVAAAFPLGAAALFDAGWTMVAETGLVFLLGESIVGQFVEPVLFGHRTRLSPIAVVAGAAFWTFIWGPVGLLIATPLTLAIVVLGHHVPGLNFIAVMLGNEAPLSMPEQFYHQLLLGDMARATHNAEEWIAEKPFLEYLDEVALPGLSIAANDQRRGILEGASLDKTTQALDEFMESIVEQTADATPARAADLPRLEIAPRLLMLGGRGAFDHAGARLVGHCSEQETEFDLMRVGMPGLNGLSAVLAGDARPDVVVLVSVGGATPGQMRLIAKRARRNFPDMALHLLTFERDKDVSQWDAQAEGATVSGSAAQLMDHLRRCYHEFRANTERVPVGPRPVEKV